MNLTTLIVILVTTGSNSFQPSLTQLSSTGKRQQLNCPAQFVTVHDVDPDHGVTPPRRSRISRFFSKRLKPFGLGLFSLAVSLGASSLVHPPLPAYGATPLPKSATMPDAEKTAMRSIQLEMEKKQFLETEQYNKRARQIEASGGPKARDAFEKEYRAAKEQRDQELLEELEELQRSLLDQGIDPFNDMEGYRQCFLLKTGKDLAEVEGTDQYADAQIVKMGLKKQSYSYQKAINREIIKLIVQDYKSRGIDPLPEFSNKENHPRHANILFLTNAAAMKRITVMQGNLAMYGQIDAPKPGELSLKEKLEADPDLAIRNQHAIERVVNKGSDSEVGTRAAEKQRVQQEKEKRRKEAQQAKEEAQKAKEEARMAREAVKEAARLAKEQAKQENEAAKAAMAAAAAAAASQAVAQAADTVIDAASEMVEQTASFTLDSIPSEKPSLQDFEDDSKFSDETGLVITKSVSMQTSKGLPLAKVGGLAAVVVGGKFVIDRRSQPSEADEAERQRKLNLLMGITDDENKIEQNATKILDVKNAVDADVVMPSIDSANGNEALTPSVQSLAASSPTPETELPKKRGLGIKSIFNKKKNDRETNLNVLLSPSAIAPEVAMILSKLLTFGAPGRFPQVNALAGGMPIETFELDKAKEILEVEVEKAGITRDEGAEVFANVVNCMLIDIIDLASSSLGKEASVTYDAINVVINFMNHAASLYDAVAAGVEITPVTYGGNLPKSKLEQLYGAYAFSAMMKMDEDMADRIELLRNVFSISEKKAEGIIMNASQKQMMEMLKTEEGQKQMEEMMGGLMGGMEGMEGLGAMADLMGKGAGDAEPNPEQLKEMLIMLKTMKDSGSIPREELATVRDQFRESFGSSIDDILRQADASGGEMSSSDKELLDLMKGILED